METSRNLEGLDDLSLEMWMSQQQQQIAAASRPGFQGTGYHQMVDQHQGRAYLPPRNTLPSSSLADSAGHISYQQHQFQRVPASSHGSFDHNSQDRSAWSHLLSLEASMTSSASYPLPMPSAEHLLDSFPPALMKSNSGHTGPLAISREHPSMYYPPATASSTSAHSSFTDMSFQSLPHDKVSQHLNQLMNLSRSGTSSPKVPFSQPLTVSTELPSLEGSGDYSPVSPPAAAPMYEDSLMGFARQQGKVTNMLSREPHFSALTTSQSQVSGLSMEVNPLLRAVGTAADYTSQVSLGVTSGQSFPVSVSNRSRPFATSPSDMPLDMTTAVAQKSDLRQGDSTSQAQNFTLPVASNHDRNFMENIDFISEPTKQFPVSVSSDLATGTRETVPFLQALLKTEKDHESSNQLQLPASGLTSAPALSEDKNTKLIKSTPKKSNFYGRDVSLFAVSEENEASSNDSSVNMPLSGAQNAVADSGHASFKEVAISDAITQSHESESPLNHTSVQAETKPLATVIIPQSSRESTGNTESRENSSGTMQPTVSSVTLSQALSASQPCLDKEINKQEDTSGFSMTGDLEIAEKKIDFDVSVYLENTEAGKIANVIDENKPSDMEGTVENVLNSYATASIKKPKGKKRKAPGAVKKAGKKAAKNQTKAAELVPLVPQSVVVLERTNIEINPVDSQVQNNSDDDKKVLSHDTTQSIAPVKKGSLKRTNKNAKLGDESQPRRSSSRKSKDNAMRLIELQADAGYVRIPGVDEDLPPKKMSRKRAIVPITGKTFSQTEEPELSDLSSDSSSLEDTQQKDKDGDYVVDEEEAEAVAKEDCLEDDKLSSKTFVSKKKPGSLRISIKLSGGSSAEIVSGIEDSPVKKKRKPGKKKASKIKTKTKLNPPSENFSSEVDKNVPVEEIKAEANNQVDANMDKQTSLMEKYFSAAKQNLGKLDIKSSKSKKNIDKSLNQRLSKLSTGKTKNLGPKNRIQKRLASPGPNTSKSESGETKDNGVPKFRCGYCPQRYHSKLDLLTHMDEHMSEMESKDSNISSSPSKNFSQTSDKNPLHNSNNSHLKHGSKSVAERILPKDKSSPLGQQKFKCFTERNLSSAHRKTPVPENLLRCQMCSKAFIHQADLDQHMLSHPTRSTGTSSSSTLALKNLKKPAHQKLKEKSSPVSVKKGTSFASALSGDIDDCGTNSGVLVLKRKEILTPLTPKVKSETPSKAAEAGHRTIPPKVNPSDSVSGGVNCVTKNNLGAGIQRNTEIDKDNEIETSKKPAEEASSGVCTCKECPDCVTRFLESFA